MSNMMDLLRELYPFRMAPVSNGSDQMVQRLQKELPFTIHEYASGSEHNGWVVPKKWEVQKAEIRRDGAVLYDGLAHPLGVIGSSESFTGRLHREQLREHLFFHPELSDALVYHCDLYYKVGRKDWGFSVPRTFYEGLPTGEYEVELKTVHEDGMMKVADFFLKGQSDQTILLNAHNCHPACANDDIAGVVVGVEVMRRLKRKANRYSYRLIVAPEHLGTVFYLGRLSDEIAETFRYCLFLEMLGNDNRLAFQESFTGRSLLDRATYQYLRSHRPDFFSDGFRKIVGNDESVWEAPGFEIPTISLSRFPYPEYHSSDDTDEIIAPEKLEDAAQAVLGILRILETNCSMRRKFKGLVALSNPKYDLYKEWADPSIRPTISETQKKWHHLMDGLPRYFDGKTTVLDVAEMYELPYDEVYEYIVEFQKKGLVEMVLPTSPQA